MNDDDANDRGDDANDRGDGKKDRTNAPGRGGSGVGGSAPGFDAGVGLGVFSGLLESLLDLGSHSSRGTPMSPGHRGTPGFRKRRRDTTDDTSSPERTEGDGSSESGEHLVDTRRHDDEFVVTADIPGVTMDDLSVGIRRRTNDLLISREGSVLERIDIPWASPEATRVWLNNGVLVVRLQPADT